MPEKKTKRGLMISKGMLESENERLKSQLAVEPKSAAGEANKLAVRLLVGLVAGVAVKSLYNQFPIIGEVQPDMQPVIDALIVIGTMLITAWLDKYRYQKAKNAGKVGQGVGIDGMFITLSNLFTRKKTAVQQ